LQPVGAVPAAWSIAPIDGGADVPQLAQQLLLATIDLGELRLDVRAVPVGWRWRGDILGASASENVVQLRACGLVAEIDTARVIAVSYGVARASSGVYLCDELGVFLTLWSTDTLRLDRWLGAALAGPMGGTSAVRTLKSTARLNPC
jgi:hypothetical protein